MVLGIFKKRKVTYDDASYGCEVQIVRLQGRYKKRHHLFSILAGLRSVYRFCTLNHCFYRFFTRQRGKPWINPGWIFYVFSRTIFTLYDRHLHCSLLHLDTHASTEKNAEKINKQKNQESKTENVQKHESYKNCLEGSRIWIIKLVALYKLPVKKSRFEFTSQSAN